MADWFAGFEAGLHAVNGTTLFARSGGNASGPPVLLLHGFPQTHAIWHRIAARLADRFFLVMPDLRGYGGSAKPPGAADHGNYSKRTMAADVAALMERLGHARYAVVGHDRGGRVAHRLALDAPQAVERLALIDIAPTLDMYEATDLRFASAYHHWFHLIQPAPLPERMIEGCAAFYLHSLLGGWRTDRAADRLGWIEAPALADYERGFCHREAIHAACEDYRASAGIDLDHDRASRAAGDRIGCDTLLLWGAHGVVGRLFDPLALWRAQCSANVSGQVLDGGHFLPEELHRATGDALLAHLDAWRAA